ncbi:hypothetical protein FRC10_006209, partial [Ceratobasidium sp. 414]
MPPACPCCGNETLNDQQRCWHLVARRRQLEVALDAMNEGDAASLAPNDASQAPNYNGLAPGLALGSDLAPGDNLAPSDNLALGDDLAPGGDLAAGNNGMVLDEITPAPGNAGEHRRGVNLAALVAREDGSDRSPVGSEQMDNANNMDVDDDLDGLFAPPPVPLDPGMQRNPPVRINYWTSDDEPDLANFSPSDSDGDNDPIGAADQAPQFVEWNGPLGLDPDIEPDMDDPELWAFLEQHLGDLAHEEWIDMFNRDLTDRDRKTLRFLASHLRTHFSRTAYNNLRLHA